MYATLLVTLFHLLGIDLDEGEVTEVMLALFTLMSFSVWIYGQFTRNDLNYGLFRKEVVK